MTFEAHFKFKEVRVIKGSPLDSTWSPAYSPPMPALVDVVPSSRHQFVAVIRACFGCSCCYSQGVCYL